MKLNERKEMHALGAYVIIRPMSFNPYIDKISSSGLILVGNNMVESQETGEYIKQEQRIKYGIVMEAGADCKYFKIGDEIIFDVHSSRPVPVLDLGLVSLPEAAAICRISGDGDPFEDAIQAEREYEEQILKLAEERRKNGVPSKMPIGDHIKPASGIITQPSNIILPYQ